MSLFLSLTDTNDDQVLVNFDLVTSVHPTKNHGCTIYGGHGAPELLVTVKESIGIIVTWVRNHETSTRT
jgi:hypothetical protein